MYGRPSALAALVLLVSFAAPMTLAADDAWIAESNRHARWLLEEMARFNPELAGQNGLDGVDEEIVDLGPDVADRTIAAGRSLATELRRRIGEAEDGRVRQDLEIMLAAVDRNLRAATLNRDLMVPYFNVPQTIYFGVSSLLDPQIPAERRSAALVRLRRYAGTENGYEPATERAIALMESRFDEDGLIWPYRGQVERDLINSDRFMSGIRQLFRATSVEGFEDDLRTVESQVADYKAWLRTFMLPRARQGFRQPAALYAVALEQFGVEETPERLIADATAAFAQIRSEMAALAPLVAAERGWEETDYRDVIRRLKQDRFDDGEILPAYRETNEALEEIIRREDIVSIPPRRVAIRMKTEAEEAAVPVPSLQTPRLVGNTGEVVEFLLPGAKLAEDGDAGEADDFVFRATAWTLAAHELRPGHELQFSMMLENGVSDARALFAFNSVNVEGWALYAEAEVKPYLPLDGQLVGLQHRLMRAARAFLDPMLNTGQIDIDVARDLLVEEVVLSPRMADLEIQRYTFQAPGQATSYFYGYQRLSSLRARTEIALGGAFDRRAFHDFILAQGLLPPALIERAVRQEFIPSRPALLGRNTL